MKKIFAIALISVLVSFVSCKSKATQGKTEVVKPTQEKGVQMMETKKAVAAPTAANVDLTKKYIATIKTSKGTIVAELYPKDAPLSVTNFKQLADSGFYNGLTFHRVVPGFVIQGGDPAGTGSGGPGYTIPAEIKLKHSKGALAWARTGDVVNPERRSSGSQFYIALEPLPQLDNQYTVFGQTISGMDVVEKIQKGDKIESVEVKVE